MFVLPNVQRLSWQRWLLLALLLSLTVTVMIIIALLGPERVFVYFQHITHWLQSFAQQWPGLAPLIAVTAITLAVGLHLPILTAMVCMLAATWSYWPALLLTVLGMALGNGLSLLLLRHLGGAWAEGRWGPHLTKLAGQSQDRYLTLALLRLMTIVPYPLINAAMAMVGVRLVPYMIVGAIALLPNHLLLVAVGRQAAESQSLRGILNPLFIASLTALAGFGFVVRFFLRRTQWYQQRLGSSKP